MVCCMLSNIYIYVYICTYTIYICILVSVKTVYIYYYYYYLFMVARGPLQIVCTKTYTAHFDHFLIEMAICFFCVDVTLVCNFLIYLHVFRSRDVIICQINHKSSSIPYSSDRTKFQKLVLNFLVGVSAQ